MTGALVSAGQPGDHDDDTDVAGMAETPVSDDMWAAVAAQVEVDEISLPVPARPYLFVKFAPDIEYDDLKRWQKRCTQKKVLNELSFAFIVLGATCCGMEYERNGHRYEEFGPGGERVTFASQKLQKKVGAPIGGVPGAIKALFVKDAHILLAMHRVVEAAGYNLDDLEIAEDDDASGPLGR